jgi:hypothetical protein
MKDAISDPSVRTINPPNTNATDKIGNSPNFFCSLTKRQKFLMKLILPPCNSYCMPEHYRNVVPDDLVTNRFLWQEVKSVVSSW